MKNQKNEEVFVRVKDTDGIELVCPVGESQDFTPANEEKWDDCFEADVVGRYAGQIKIVDPVA